MATSQNGYAVTTSAPKGKLHYITGRVKPADFVTVFTYFCDRFNAEVEKIKPGWSWGWAYRPIRGQSSGYSNHASATAIDLNAPVHGLGQSGTFTPKQVQRIHAILADMDHVLRWGGDYSGRKDPMHIEVNKGPEAVAALAARIRAGKLPKSASKPQYKIKLHPMSLPYVREQFRIAVGIKPGKVRPTNGVARIQQALNAELGTKLAVDGLVGKATLAAWKRWETKVGGKDYARVPDSISLRALGKGRFNIVGLDK